jgi:hypothetical protein
MMMVSVVMAILGVGLMACDSSSSGGSMAASGGGAAAGGSIGVKECDDYIKKWNDCYKDPTMKAAAAPAFEQVKQSWAGMAKDPNQKAALAGACKTMVDNFPTAACK